MAVRAQTQRLHQDIKREFDRMSSDKALGVQKYTTDFILATLAQKFYKSPKTIENIVFNRTIKTDNQISLFNL